MHPAKRRITAALILAMTLATLASCGSDTGNSNDGTTAQTTGGEDTTSAAEETEPSEFKAADADFGGATDMSKAGPIYWLNDNSVVRNCVFYIPNAKGLRMLRAENTDPTVLGKGTFENVAYIYGSIDLGNSLQGMYNDKISGIYAVTADIANGAFKDFKKLDKAAYDAGAGAEGSTAFNSADYWTDETAATITLGDSVITGKTLKFGNTTIADLNVTEG